MCDLDAEQRARYDELHDYYRHNLARSSGGHNRMMVLEALLRLRQAACHPGLIDPGRPRESSAKLDTLTEKLLEVIAAGHNALVLQDRKRSLANRIVGADNHELNGLSLDELRDLPS